jgi:hypothetical protein
MEITENIDKDLLSLKESKKKLLEASEAEGHPKWQESLCSNSEIKMFTETIDIPGCCSVCGIGVILGTPNQILEEIRCSSNWKKMDSFLESFEYIDLMSDLRVIHLTFAGFMNIVSKRDIVYIESVKKNKDGSIIITSANTNSDIYPMDPSFVRAELKGGGWYIKPIDKTSSLVTYFTSVDFKMKYITSSIMNILTAKVPTVINTVNDILTKKLKNK